VRIAILLIATGTTLTMEYHPRCSEVVVHAKTVDVHGLDSNLEQETLEEYILRVSPKGATIRWVCSDCNLKGGCCPHPDGDPLCVSIGLARGCDKMRVDIQVGTHGDAIHRTPAVRTIETWRDGASPLELRPLMSLGDVEKILDKWKARRPTTGCT
jgi:hypothetical protein